MTGNKEIRKWVGRECKYHTHFITSRAARIRVDWTTKLDWDRLWVKTKNWHSSTSLFWNKFSVSADFSILFLFLLSLLLISFLTCQVVKKWFELSRLKLYRNFLKGNENYFELAGVSSYGKSTVLPYFTDTRCEGNFVFKNLLKNKSG